MGSSKNTTSIDIIIPYWGDFFLLKQTVDSVMVQTSKEWHLTILDDHYPSKKAYNHFKQLNDPRITYIRHGQNLGITNNFNYAIKIASAPYCTIIGCDDRLLPDYIEIALGNISKADFYQPYVGVIDANGIEYLPIADRVKRWLRPKKPGIYHGEDLATSLCHGDWLYFPAITWKTSVLKTYRFDSAYKIVEDLDLILRMIIDGASLYLDTRKTFQYRRFDESLSSKEKGKQGVRFNEEKRAYDVFSNRFTKAGWKKAALAAKLHVTSRIHAFISH